MPRIPQNYLDCIAYLYPSREEAESGQPTGGTGFLLGINGEFKEDLRCYIVTNAHVASECTWVRFHNAGQTLFTEIPAVGWKSHRSGHDIAMARFEHPRLQSFSYVNVDALVTPEMIREYGIAPGMDAFMMGRLIRLDGRQQTNPSVRFGHLSMMVEEVPRDDGLNGESFLVDLPCIPGNSGSPVFIFESQQHFKGDTAPRLNDIRLLGINWGSFGDSESVFRASGEKVEETEFWTYRNDDFACVAPAWRILELINEFLITGMSSLNET
jgi:hypothetical protein